MPFPKIFNFSKKKNKKKNINSKPTKKTKKIGKHKTSLKTTRKKTKIPQSQKQVFKKEDLVAKATHYFPKIKVAVLRMKGEFKIKDKIYIKGHTTDFKQTVMSMQINHKPISVAKKGQEIGLLVKRRIRHNDKVYKV